MLHFYGELFEKQASPIFQLNNKYWWMNDSLDLTTKYFIGSKFLPRPLLMLMSGEKVNTRPEILL